MHVGIYMDRLYVRGVFKKSRIMIVTQITFFACESSKESFFPEDFQGRKSPSKFTKLILKEYFRNHQLSGLPNSCRETFLLPSTLCQYVHKSIPVKLFYVICPVLLPKKYSLWIAVCNFDLPRNSVNSLAIFSGNPGKFANVTKILRLP